MQEGAVRHGRNGILPVLLDGHAALVDGWEHQICHCFGRCTVIKLVHRGVNRRVIKTTRYRATGAAARVLLVGLFRSSGTSGPVGQVPTAFLCSLELLPVLYGYFATCAAMGSFCYYPATALCQFLVRYSATRARGLIAAVEMGQPPCLDTSPHLAQFSPPHLGPGRVNSRT